MIYIQSNSEKTQPHHFDCSCAMFGAIESAMDFKLVSYDDVKNGKYDLLIKRNLFVGSVEFMKEVFNRVGIIPDRLPNSNREFETITLGEARERAKDGENLFIKPFDVKLFTGFVIDQSEYTSIKNINNDVLIMCYEPFKHRLTSEWRVYVLNNQMVDSRNYSGDFTINPNYNYVNKIISENKGKFPCSYVIDIGILENMENVVIEYNDMWSIGNYGVPNDLYLNMLKLRYNQIING